MTYGEIGPPVYRRVRRKNRTRLSTANKDLASYLRFGPCATCLVCLIALLYITFLICALPMLHYDSSESDLKEHHEAFERAFEGIQVPHIPSRHRIKNVMKVEEEKIVKAAHDVKKKLSDLESKEKENFVNVAKTVKEKLHDLQAREGQNLVRMAQVVKEKFIGSQHENNFIESDLMDAAIEKFNKRNENDEKKDSKNFKSHNELQIQAQKENEGLKGKNEGLFKPPNGSDKEKKGFRKKKGKLKNDEDYGISAIPQDKKKTGGFILLGMHRSGTSLLGGILVESLGFKVGSPLINAKPDNPKGFYELLPAVLQNDEFLKSQGADWSANVIHYNALKALTFYTKHVTPNEDGKKALEFLQNEDNFPWMLKDPRMCITLRTWLPILDTKPAILFTYRDPMSVAFSLKKRQTFQLIRGLRLWIIYNMRAIQNSKELCRVISSNDAILQNPLIEVKRIFEQLTNKCNVPKPQFSLKEEFIDNFLDHSLQHGKKNEDDKQILTYHGDCEIPNYESDFEEGSSLHKKEMDMYLKAMTIFCDLKSGEAFKTDYSWPDLTYREKN